MKPENIINPQEPKDPPAAPPSPNPADGNEPSDNINKNKNNGSSFYKQKIEELERQNKEKAAELENLKMNQLKEKENYKELYEIEKKKRTEAEQKAVKISKDYLTGLKMSAIEQEALKAGILPEALADIRPDDASMVEIETGDRGTITINGAKEYVEYLKEKKKHWFKTGTIPRINNQNPSNPEEPRTLTGRELVELQKKDPAKYELEMKKLLNKK